MDKALMVNVELALHWQSRHARHIDRSFFERINLWRDFFPGDMAAPPRRRPGSASPQAVLCRPVNWPGRMNPVWCARCVRAKFHPARPGLERCWRR